MEAQGVLIGTIKDALDPYFKNKLLLIKKQEIMKSLSKITDTSHTINADLDTIR